MSRYIDADKLFLHFNDWALAVSPDERHSDVPEYSEHKIHEMIYRTINEAMSAIEQQPTADVIDRNECSICVLYPFKQLREQVVHEEWIPCSERLPYSQEDVLCDDDGRVTIGYYTDEEVGWHDTHSYRIYPTAWMPLPEPWGERREDEIH